GVGAIGIIPGVIAERVRLAQNDIRRGSVRCGDLIKDHHAIVPAIGDEQPLAVRKSIAWERQSLFAARRIELRSGYGVHTVGVAENLSDVGWIVVGVKLRGVKFDRVVGGRT